MTKCIAVAICFFTASRGLRMGKVVGGAVDLLLTNNIIEKAENDLLRTNHYEACISVGSTHAW